MAEPGVWSCAICLRDKSPEEAFLDGCFHRFCLLCISRWTDTQRAHPPAAGPAFTCPLCKAAYTSILHDWHHNSYKRNWVTRDRVSGDTLPDGANVDLTAVQRRRRASYFTQAAQQPDEMSGRAGPQSVSAAAIARADVAAWVRRELIALMLEQGVDIVAAHIGGTMRSVCKPLPRRGPGAAAAGGGASCQAFVSAVEEAARPYVFEHARSFAEKLFDFAASGRSLAADDRAAGAAADLAAGPVAAATDSDRESGELSAELSGSAAAALAAAGSEVDSEEGPARSGGGREAGNRKSPSPDRGSACVSFSIGSALESSDSDAYLPLVKAAAAQRAKTGAASRGNGAANGGAAAAFRRGADAEDTAASSVASGSGAQRIPDDAPDPAGAAAENGPRRRVGQHEARSGGPRTSREPHQRHSAAAGGAAQWRAPASAGRVASAAAPEAGGTVAQQPASDAERLRRRALKFGTPLPQPGSGALASGQSPAPTATNGGGGTGAMGNAAAAKAADGGGAARQPKSRHGRPQRRVDAEARPAELADIRSPAVLPPREGADAATRPQQVRDGRGRRQGRQGGADAEAAEQQHAGQRHARHQHVGGAGGGADGHRKHGKRRRQASDGDAANGGGSGGRGAQHQRVAVACASEPAAIQTAPRHSVEVVKPLAWQRSGGRAAGGDQLRGGHEGSATGQAAPPPRGQRGDGGSGSGAPSAVAKRGRGHIDPDGGGLRMLGGDSWTDGLSSGGGGGAAAEGDLAQLRQKALARHTNVRG